MRPAVSRFAPALCCLALALPTPAQAPDTIVLKVVRYDGLTDLIKQQRGKVLVVDFWADFCVPCKREFPNLVALHQKYAKDGFVAVSVSLDDPTDDDAKAKALKFLRAQKATFTNVLLDEKPEVWQAKLKIDGPPLVMVFARDGKLEQRFVDKAVDYAEIGKLVAELLKK
jgi:thiol-disulfide isomerase/thioredoxin